MAFQSDIVVGQPAGAEPARIAPVQTMAGVGDYFALMKPRVMSLVVFTGLVGLVVAPASIHPVTAFAALLCIAVGAGAAGALNMWYDADIDALMRRTASRPVPAGRVSPGEALGFGSTMAVGSVLIMGVLVNWTAAALLALTIGFYLFVYTIWLKRRTPQNIVIGGASGAFPPMIGWAAATGGVDPGSVALFAIIFMWTPPHFWSLALYRAGDYERAGVPMLPVVAGGDETRRQIFIYSVLLVGVAFAPAVLGIAGVLYMAVAALMGAGFVFGAWKVFRIRAGQAADRQAKAFFRFSIFYLFALFAALLVESIAADLAPYLGVTL
ncbi:Heme O synthase, protoheme IX farnesyltransferase COX10-CtaB [hydrothermal vent metagenome]|uniref:Protoheme IX farnesyltransferase n=1 Tax=hydrothermal vent metagenome TaxID=652676 RepID=A0A3B0TFS7_9ZZZZ